MCLVEFARTVQVDPNGFSMMTREFSTKFALCSVSITAITAVGRDAQIVQQTRFAAERLALLGYRLRQRLRTILLGDEGQIGDELIGELIRNLVVSELAASLPRLLAESLAVDFVE